MSDSPSSSTLPVRVRRPLAVAALQRALPTTGLYAGYGVLGLLLVAGLGGHDLALLFIGSLATLYGAALTKALTHPVGEEN